MLLAESLKQVLENGFSITLEAVLKYHEIQSFWFYYRHFYSSI